jgi:hypothetical protein
MELMVNILFGWGSFLLSITMSTVSLWIAWNYVVPEMFGMPEISIWQALALSWVSHSLFKPYVLTQFKKE